MNNFDQETTYHQALGILEEIESVAMLRFHDLERIIDIYSWLSSNDIMIDATFKDLFNLHFDETDIFTEEGRKLIQPLIDKLI
jgi:hypothetical protein